MYNKIGRFFKILARNLFSFVCRWQSIIFYFYYLRFFSFADFIACYLSKKNVYDFTNGFGLSNWQLYTWLNTVFHYLSVYYLSRLSSRGTLAACGQDCFFSCINQLGVYTAFGFVYFPFFIFVLFIYLFFRVFSNGGRN